MSSKIIIANSFGLFKSSAKIEAAHEALLAAYRMFVEFEDSSLFKEYLELDALVKSPAFKQKKHEIQHLTLKGSKEEAQLKELGKLNRNRRLQKYYMVLKSKELKRFEEIGSSDLMKKYKEVKTSVERHSLAALKKMDKQSKEYAIYSEFTNLHDTPDLTFFRNFRKSPGYRNFELMAGSPDRNRFEELQQITATEEFKVRVAYLEDKDKWTKTNESAKEKRLDEILRLPQTINYLKYKNSNVFDFFKKWKLVFEDKFEEANLDLTKWQTIAYKAKETLGRNFSQPGDLQAFSEGKNVTLDRKSLKIEIRKEKAKGMQWQMPFGFVEKDFDYTSGLISTAGIDWWKHGIIEAKVKYNPCNNLVDAIYLLGEENSPQINLVEMGAKNRVGLLSKNKEEIETRSFNISGLTKGEFYIFSLEWTAQSLIWKINGYQVLKLTDHLPAFPMHLNAASIAIAEPIGQLPHTFEIDWIRCYQ